MCYLTMYVSPVSVFKNKKKKKKNQTEYQTLQTSIRYNQIIV